MTAIKKYYSSKTKFKIWGDALLFVCPLLTAVVLELPVSDFVMKWMMAGLNIFTIAGKFLLNRYDAMSKEKMELNEKPETHEK